LKKILQLSTVHKSNDIRVYEKITRTLVETENIIYLIAIESDVELDKRLIYYPLKNKFSISILNRLYNNLKSLVLINRIKPNVIHIHDPELLLIGVICRLFGFIIVYDVHEDLTKDIMHKNMNKVIKKIISFLIEPFEIYTSIILKNVIVVTPSIFKRFEGKVKNLVIIRNFPNNGLINNQNFNPNKVNYVLYSGTISVNRGIYEIIDSVAKFNGKVRLILVGQFQNEELMANVMNYKGWEFVDFKGYVNQGQLYEYYASSLIGLVTLHDIDTYREAFPVKLFEYINSGMPVVMSNFPLWKKIFDGKEVGVSVNPSDSNEIFNAINTIFDNYEEFKKTVYSFKGIYTWENEKKGLIDFYKKI
jgi:glycosyltransferase involved in cell wall biosynthesis